MAESNGDKANENIAEITLHWNKVTGEFKYKVLHAEQITAVGMLAFAQGLALKGPAMNNAQPLIVPAHRPLVGN